MSSDGEDYAAVLLPGAISPIDTPLASAKAQKYLIKAIRKAAGAKLLRRGVKESVKALRKGFKGVCLLAGDTNPIDVISHMPVLCEDNQVQYVFMPQRAMLGAAAGTKRATCCLLLPLPASNDAAHRKYYEKALKELKQ